MDIINSVLDFVNINIINNVIFIEEQGFWSKLYDDTIGRATEGIALAVVSPLILIIVILLIPVLAFILFKIFLRVWGFYKTFKMIKNLFGGGKNKKKEKRKQQRQMQNTINNKMMMENK